MDKDSNINVIAAVLTGIIAVIIVMVLYTGASKENESTKNTISTRMDFPKKIEEDIDWKSDQISLLKSDSAAMANTDYLFLANQSNAIMSEAIDRLNKWSPRKNWVEAEKEFYDNDKRASIPLKFIRSKAIRILKQVMPSYRKAFAKNLGKALWEEDIYVTASGSYNTILNVTGGIFASNKNIADFQGIIDRDVQHFEFKEIRYRWYKDAEEYTSYKY